MRCASSIRIPCNSGRDKIAVPSDCTAVGHRSCPAGCAADSSHLSHSSLKPVMHRLAAGNFRDITSSAIMVPWQRLLRRTLTSMPTLSLPRRRRMYGVLVQISGESERRCRHGGQTHSSQRIPTGCTSRCSRRGARCRFGDTDCSQADVSGHVKHDAGQNGSDGRERLRPCRDMTADDGRLR